MRKKLFAAGVAAVLLAGACSQVERLDPALQLRAAAKHLGAAKQAGFTLKLTGSADDLIKAFKVPAEDEKSLRTLLGSSITVAYDQAGEGPQDDRVLLAATVGGVAGTELRVVDKTLYAKVPVTDLAQRFDAGDISQMRAQAVATTPSLGALFDGRWVSLDLKDALDGPGKALGLPAGDQDTTKTVDELKTSGANLVDGASIVRDPADDKHLVVTSSTAKAYAELQRLVAAAGGDRAKGLRDEIGKAPKDRPIVLDLWVDKENLTAVEVNLLQFIDGTTGRAALRLEMTTGAPITAPDGATKIDAAALSDLSGPSDVDLDEALMDARMIGNDAVKAARSSGGKPAAHLKEVVADWTGLGVDVKIVRTGTAQVTDGKSTACVKVPPTVDRQSTVTRGACA